MQVLLHISMLLFCCQLTWAQSNIGILHNESIEYAFSINNELKEYKLQQDVFEYFEQANIINTNNSIRYEIIKQMKTGKFDFEKDRWIVYQQLRLSPSAIVHFEHLFANDFSKSVSEIRIESLQDYTVTTNERELILACLDVAEASDFFWAHKDTNWFGDTTKVPKYKILRADAWGLLAGAIFGTVVYGSSEYAGDRLNLNGRLFGILAGVGVMLITSPINSLIFYLRYKKGKTREQKMERLREREFNLHPDKL